MSNIFRGGDYELDMSNGGTAVFVDVMMLAASAVARCWWDFWFVALIAFQDQDVMGRGCVGFRLEDIHWGSTPDDQASAKDFVIRATDLALTRHRWTTLGYDPPFAPNYLRTFRTMVAAFDPSTAAPDPHMLPDGDEVVAASCTRHRVLTALPWYQECLFCGRSSLD